MRQRSEQRLVEQLVTQPSDEGLDEGVLLRFAGLACVCSRSAYDLQRKVCARRRAWGACLPRCISNRI